VNAGAALIFRAHGVARALGRHHQHIEIIETTFKEECETDLFGEQTVL
jgi:ketol-acid reductoisomerase